MKITVVGGGPAGLWFALLMKKREPRHAITIFERNAAGATFGFGVVFSRKTTELLRACDDELFQRAEGVIQRWDNVDVIHRGEKVSIRGNHFAGVARLDWLRMLEERCRDVGIPIRFEEPVADPRPLARECDLLVGSDGVNSLVRDTWRDAFQPTLDARRNRYIWLGSPHLFHGLTLIFRPRAAGLFMAHAYKFSRSMSTFIVECDESTWRAAGLDRMDDAATLRFLEEVFADDLGGAPLVSNRSKWIQFLLVRNRRWIEANVVLLGDAAHTAHFSIGSGTKLAMEDSIALFEACTDAAAGGDVGRALALFEARRKPRVDDYQQAAYSSTLWFENAHEKLALDPVPFAYDCMTRSGRIDLENLRQRDAAFARQYEAWCRDHPAAAADPSTFAPGA